MKQTLTLLALFTCLILSAQDTTLCETFVADSAEMAQLEQLILNPLNAKTGDCTTLRVVVHVVYDGAANNESYNGYITEEQVLSQIRITNQFLRNDSLMYHADNTPLGYTVELAKTDPFGNPTTGIIYHDGTALFGTAWSTYGLRNTNANAVSVGVVASAIAWGTDIDGKRYINSYVVPRIDGNMGGGVQAYAYFPTTNVVFGNYNLYNAFGAEQLEAEYDQTFNLKSYTDLGLTWTHELLHNLAIYHTFEGNSCIEPPHPFLQGDRVADTPPQTKGQGCYGSCDFVSYNVMDYLNQGCKHRITQGQVDRAVSVINASLPHFLVCQDCDVSTDLNGDGMVNMLDVSLMSGMFGTSNPLADLNCDGVVNMMDVSVLNNTFNSVISAAAVQEMRGVQIYNTVGQRVTGILAPGIYIAITNGVAQRIVINQ